jgi:general secretion pathway protein G
MHHQIDTDMKRAVQPAARVMGYTVLEIMITVLIIGVIGAIAWPNIGKARNKARTEQAKADLEMLSSAILQLAWDTGNWPGGLDRSVVNDAETWNLATSNAGILTASATLFPGWRGPYMRSVPLDPWGSPYFFDPDYRVTGENHIVVGSFGPNRVGQNYYDEDDIYILLDDAGGRR